MRNVPSSMTDIWTGGEFTGDKQPIGRVTIQKMKIQMQKVDSTRLFTTAVFGQGDIPRELPNVKSVEWQRSVGVDVATCTIVFYNTTPLPLGTTPEISGDFDLPGYYTFNYGATSWSNSRWGHAANQWQDWLMPDRIIRTYEGYGFDNTVIPEDDANLIQTGMWLIDDVEFTHDGLITVTCRDVGRLLLDQIMFPPVIPLARYPLEFEAYHQVDNPDIVTTTGSVSRPTYAYDSGIPYGGTNHDIYGHRPSDAFDGSINTYWMSVGNALPSAGYSFEFVEGAVNGTVSAVSVRVWGGPYKAYLSLMVGGKWQGRSEIPYDENNPVSAPNGSDVNYVTSMRIGHEATGTFKLATPMANVQRVRVTFTNLFNSGIGPYRYRAGVRDIQVSSQKTVTKDGGTHTEGDYGDYTEIVKYLLACGGFHWPATANAFFTKSDGSTASLAPPSNDPYLKSGRVWGDLETSGTNGPAALGVDVWDKKPLMDGIAYVRDILSFIFFVDETGGAVFRMPNIWSVGNYVGDNSYNAGRSSDMITIDEAQTLLGLRAKISSRNIRENVFVANTNGKIGAVASGYNPITPDPNLRRVAGWCVDDQTEIFTNRGWLRYDQVHAGDLTLSLTDDGHATWQPIKEVAIFPARPRAMVRITANNFDALTTPNHRWLAEKYSTGTREWSTQYVTTDDITALTRVARSRAGAAAQVRTLDDALVELIAWAYTEGAIRWCRRGTSPTITIYQSPTANPGECESIRLAMKKAFGETGWSSRVRKGCEEFRLGAAASRALLAHLDKTKAPTIDFLSKLTQDQLELFIDVSVRADGCTRLTSEHSSQVSRFFYQNVGPRLDAFLSACALAGIATSVHVRSGEGNWHGKGDVATVTLLQTTYASVGQMERADVDYDGIIWCPSMPDNHNWLARRNGATYYTGNTDQHFQTVNEAQVMADLITVRQMFEFRSDSLQIVAYPAIQIDDQVRIYERVTNEGYVHYVKSIKSTNDLEAGKWTYDLETHWLGEAPFSKWAFDPTKLSAATQTYLHAIGKL